MSSVTLFKWESKYNKYRYWSAEIINTDKDKYYIEIKTKLGDNGKETIRKKLIEEMKNKPPQEKAMSLFNSLVNEKIEKGGYSKQKTEDKAFFPMIFKDYKKDNISIQNKIKNMKKIVVQNKLDGIRMYYYDGITYSRSGKEIVTLNHIKDELDKITVKFGEENGHLKDLGILIDGEIYIHDNSEYYVTDIAGLINAKDTQDKTLVLEYHIFDIFWYDYDDLTYLQRYDILKSIFINNTFKKLKLVPIDVITNNGSFDVFKEIDNYLKKALKNGYEGIIIRNGEEEYIPASGKSNGRSNNYKYKGTSEDEYLIKNIEHANRDQDISVVFILEDISSNKIFKVNGCGTFEYQKKIYDIRNELIGKKLRVKYYGLTIDGLPFHANPVIKSGKYIIIN